MTQARQITRAEYDEAVRKGRLASISPINHLTGVVVVTHTATGRREELVVEEYAAEVPYLACDYSRSIVLVYSVGTSVTHYVGLDGCRLTTLSSPTSSFDKEFEPYKGLTPADYVKAYAGDSSRVRIPIDGAALRVLRAILAQRGNELPADLQPERLEKLMAEAAPATKRSPDGPVAQVHAFLDKKLEAVRAGTVSRKELIDQLAEKGINASTATTQAGVWARTNGVMFARPKQAEATKKTAAASKRAAKKASKS